MIDRGQEAAEKRSLPAGERQRRRKRGGEPAARSQTWAQPARPPRAADEPQRRALRDGCGRSGASEIRCNARGGGGGGGAGRGGAQRLAGGTRPDLSSPREPKAGRISLE